MKSSVKIKGFSLIELMIVVAILAILIVAGVPSYQNFIVKSNMRTAGQVLLKDGQYLDKYYSICGSYAKDSSNTSTPPCLRSSLGVSSSRIVWPTPLPYPVSPESGTALYSISFNSSKPYSSCSSGQNCINQYMLKATPICDTAAAQNNSCACIYQNAPTTIRGGNKICYICLDQDNNLLCNADASCSNTSGNPC